MIRAAVVAIAVATAAPAAAAPAFVAIGDLVLDYDDAEWKIAAWPDGALILPRDCAAPSCGPATSVRVGLAPAQGPLPDKIPATEGGFVKPLWALMDLPDWPGDGAIREINGLAIFATDQWSGCRAMSPSRLTAILDHAGRRYTFTSGIAAGCGGVWGVGREAFAAILSGLRPRR